MGSEHGAGVEDAHGLGRDDEGASHGQESRVVCIESRVGCRGSTLCRRSSRSVRCVRNATKRPFSLPPRRNSEIDATAQSGTVSTITRVLRRRGSCDDEFLAEHAQCSGDSMRPTAVPWRGIQHASHSLLVNAESLGEGHAAGQGRFREARGRARPWPRCRRGRRRDVLRSAARWVPGSQPRHRRSPRRCVPQSPRLVERIGHGSARSTPGCIRPAA